MDLNLNYKGFYVFMRTCFIRDILKFVYLFLLFSERFIFVKGNYQLNNVECVEYLMAEGKNGNNRLFTYYTLEFNLDSFCRLSDSIVVFVPLMITIIQNVIR